MGKIIDYLSYRDLEKVMSGMIVTQSQGVTTALPRQLLALSPFEYIGMGHLAILIPK